jgi:hypothetical protein
MKSETIKSSERRWMKLNALLSSAPRSVPLPAGSGSRAEVDRARKIEQEPGGDLAILVVLAHVRRLQPRGHVPVDVAHVVAVLVLAQVRQVQTKTAKQRAVIAVQEPVEPTDHRPLDAPQQRVRIALWAQRGH